MIRVRLLITVMIRRYMSHICKFLWQRFPIVPEWFQVAINHHPTMSITWIWSIRIDNMSMLLSYPNLVVDSLGMLLKTLSTWRKHTHINIFLWFELVISHAQLMDPRISQVIYSLRMWLPIYGAGEGIQFII